MESKTIVPKEHDLDDLTMHCEHASDLVRQAEESDAADRRLTVKQALKQYKTAVFWAMFLSTSLIMEGFDLVTVSHSDSLLQTANAYDERSTPFTAYPSSRIDLGSRLATPEQRRFPRVGRLGCRMLHWRANSSV